MDVLTKSVLQIILVAKSLVRHSSMCFPNKQRRPLPFLLIDSDCIGVLIADSYLLLSAFPGSGRYWMELSLTGNPVLQYNTINVFLIIQQKCICAM